MAHEKALAEASRVSSGKLQGSKVVFGAVEVSMSGSEFKTSVKGASGMSRPDLTGLGKQIDTARKYMDTFLGLLKEVGNRDYK